ncbi:MFS transporter [Streptomyces sp. NPDC059003]|uniref:MFS transporter n=1 Tax=Streptomyces sp. NPDC059003 TaxID=3346691 RepID=UPI0036C2D454
MSKSVDEAQIGEQTEPPVAVRRTRWLLTGYFASQGVIMATWATRLPAVKEAVGISPGRLSIALLAASLGMIVMLSVSGRIAERPRGTSRLLVGAVLTLGTALVLLGQVRAFGALVAVAVVFGCGQGLLLVPLNAAGVAVQRRFGKPVMASLHASYSIGAVGAAGAATATARFSHTIVFTVVGATVIIAALVTAPATLSLAEADTPTSVPDSTSRRRGMVWLLGVMVAAGLITEGTALDWSAVHVRSLGVSATTAAAAYFAYGIGMAMGRLTGDALTVRLGPPRLLRTGALVAAVGLGAGLAASSTAIAAPAALIGWAVLGVGLSPIVPLLYTTAGTYGPRAVASVSTIGNIGLLAGPAAVGGIATAASLTLALTVPVVLAAALALASRTVAVLR